MFRSALLDWSRPALVAASAKAFALLMEAEGQTSAAESGAASLATVVARWSLAHGLAMLLIDGRLAAIARKASGPDIDTLVEGVLTKSL